MAQLIQYKSRSSGYRAFAPVYHSFTVRVVGETSKSSAYKREINVASGDTCVTFPKLLGLRRGYSEQETRFWVGQGYRLLPDSRGRIDAVFMFDYQQNSEDSDLQLNGRRSILARKAGELSKGATSKLEIAENIYEYVFLIPFTGEGGFGKPITPTEVIRTNKAHKCVCKAQLFEQLCRISGIPAREQHCHYYADDFVSRPARIRRNQVGARGHSFAAFFAGKWRLADPTLGGFDSSFTPDNYYDCIVSEKGFGAVTVDVV